MSNSKIIKHIKEVKTFITRDQHIFIRQVITEQGVFYRPVMVRVVDKVVHDKKWFGFCKCSRIETREFEVPMILVTTPYRGKSSVEPYVFEYYDNRFDGYTRCEYAQFKTFPAMVKTIRTISDIRIIDSEIK